MAFDLTFGIGLTAMVLIAVFAIGLYVFGGKRVKQPISSMLLVVGVVACLLSVGAWAGAGNYMGGEPATIAESAAYDVTVSEAESEVFVYANEHRIVVAVSFNDTSDAFVSSTGVFTLNYTMIRADALMTDAVARLYLGGVPAIDVAGSADEFILDENADGTFNVRFLKASGITSYEKANVLVEAGSSAWCSIQFTLNADAVAEMTQYESVIIPITIAGETWQISIEKAVVST